MKLNVTIDRDEDGVWVVECPAIPGCVVSVNPGASGAARGGWLQSPHEFTPTPNHIFRTCCLGPTL